MITIRIINKDNPKQYFEFSTSIIAWNKFKSMVKRAHISLVSLLENIIAFGDKEENK